MRTYDENEIGRILRRASALSAREEPDAGLGLTIEELRRVGELSGIDPNDIDLAVEELEQAPAGGEIRWWGGPLKYAKTLIVDGLMDDEIWEDLLPDIRRTFNDPGTVAIRGNTYEWTGASTGPSKNSVSCTVRDGRTRVQIFWTNETHGLPFYIPVLVGSLIAIPIIVEEVSLGWGGLPVWMAVVAMLFLVSRTFLARYARRRRTDLDRLAGRLEDGILGKSGNRLSSGVGSRTAEPIASVVDPDIVARVVDGEEKSGPALDPDDLDAGPESEPQRPRRGRQRN